MAGTSPAMAPLMILSGPKRRIGVLATLNASGLPVSARLAEQWMEAATRQK